MPIYPDLRLEDINITTDYYHNEFQKKSKNN